MTLLSILVGTLVAGMGSVWLAALLAYALLSRFTQHLLSLAAGALLATAFMRLLPEAFEQSVSAGVSAQALFAVLLVGLVFRKVICDLIAKGFAPNPVWRRAAQGLRALRC
jgi:zinc and cadmium transporter